MLLSKTSPRFLLSLFLIFSNFWIYRIFKENVLIGLILTTTTILLALQTKIQKKLIIVIMLIALFFQFQATSIQTLTILDNDDIRIQNQRMQSYPPLYFDTGVKVIWLKPAHWIEENKSAIAISRIENNLFETLDLNRYFFGGYPRNKSSDYEKLPFVLIPFFIAGVIKLLKSKSFTQLLCLFIAPLLLISVIGTNSNLGSFSLFPFLMLSTLQGIISAAGYFKNSKLFYPLLILIIVLGFILQLSYAKI